MSDLTFEANGQVVTGVQYCPRDAAGNFVPDVQLTLEGTACGSIANIVEDVATGCLTFDYTPPTTISTEQECKLVATSPDGVVCECIINLTMTCEPPIGAAGPPVDCAQSSCEILDANGDPLVGNPAVGDTIQIKFYPRTDDGTPYTFFLNDPESTLNFIPVVTNGTLESTSISFVDEPGLPPIDAPKDIEYVIYTVTVNNAQGTLSLTAPVSLCPDICTWGAPIPLAVDCETITCLVPAGGLEIGVETTIYASVKYNNGLVVSNGATFSFVGADVTSVTYDPSLLSWAIVLVPTAETVVGSLDGVLSNGEVMLEGCPDFCELSSLDTGDINCNVLCSFDPLPKLGIESSVSLVAVDGAGNPVTNLTVTPIDGLLTSAPVFNATTNEWLFKVIPAGESISFDIVSDQGSCTGVCVTDVAAHVGCRCEEICCSIPTKGLMIGVPSTISVKVPDTEGNPVGTGVAFSFTGATITSPPVYDSNTGFWDINVTPTAEMINGTLVTTDGQVCKNFCDLKAKLAIGPAQCCPVVTAVMLPFGVIGSEYTGSITFDNSMGTVAVGLPPGVTYVDGTFAGNPTSAGEFSVTIKTVAECPDLKIEMLVLAEEPDIGASNDAPCPNIQRVSAPTGVVGEPYAGFVTFTGTNGPRTYVADPATLPPGFTVVPTTGQITGTPTAVGNFNIDITVSDDLVSCTHTVNVVVIDPVVEKTCCPVIVKAPVMVSTVGESFAVQLEAVNEDGAAAQFLPGSVAPGITLTTSGVITGTATAAGDYEFTVAFSESCTQTMTFRVLEVVEECPEPRHCSMQTVKLCKGIEAGLQMRAVDENNAPVAWSGEGVLPPGVEFNNGNFIGKPTEVGVWTYSVTPAGGESTTMIMIVSDCCPEPCPVPEPHYQPPHHHHHAPPPPQQCRCVKVIESGVVINGQTYSGTLQSPTSAIKVCIEDFYRLVEQGRAIATNCP